MVGIFLHMPVILLYSDCSPLLAYTFCAFATFNQLNFVDNSVTIFLCALGS